MYISIEFVVKKYRFRWSDEWRWSSVKLADSVGLIRNRNWINTPKPSKAFSTVYWSLLYVYIESNAPIPFTRIKYLPSSRVIFHTGPSRRGNKTAWVAQNLCAECIFTASCLRVPSSAKFAKLKCAWIKCTPEVLKKVLRIYTYIIII